MSPLLSPDKSVSKVAGQLKALVGPRAECWWTGLTPEQAAATGMMSHGRVMSLPQPNTATCSREDVLRYFANGWLLNEILFSGLRGEEAFHVAPAHGLRHPMIFYYGHTACLFVNKLRVAGLLAEPVNAYFESVFEVGVDEMSWDDMSKNEMAWPAVGLVTEYRRQVFGLVSGVIASHPGLADGHAPITQDCPLWAVFMGAEHDRIHLETSAVLIRELPSHLVQTPLYWPEPAPRAVGVNVPLTFQPVPAALVNIGKPANWPSFGWDNEYGQRRAEVAAFRVSKHLVTNAQFLSFVKDNGYQQKKYWTDEGWRWRAFRNTAHPFFWVPMGPAGLHDYQLRTLFELVDFPDDWPACVNHHEARAFLAWRSERDGCAYRLLTEAEHAYLRRGAETPDNAERYQDPALVMDSAELLRTGAANMALAMGSESSVFWSQPGLFGVHDVAGNVWNWCEDDFHPLEGFSVNRLYDDFSTPCFDGQHSMILGSSFVSTGGEASIWARFHFRPHFLQHAGFHIVASLDPGPSGAVKLGANASQVKPTAAAAKYERRSVLDQYLLFHYGEHKDALPSGMEATGIGHFPQRCADLLIQLARQHGSGNGSVLDVGCSVGGASFHLLNGFEEVIGVDISAQFIDVARYLHGGNALLYRVVEEGEITSPRIARAKVPANLDRIEFEQADACALPARYEGFDAVLAANLLCRLPNPAAFLLRLTGARGLVKPGGLVMFASPFSWSEDYTNNAAWLGGRQSDDVTAWSHDGLVAALGSEFELVHRENFPFMIREHRRKFEYVVSDVTVWRRR